MDTTETTARKCPKCGNLGEQVGQNMGGDRKTAVKTMQCTTVLCPWFETNWIYSLDEHGKVKEYDYETKLYPTREEMPPPPPPGHIDAIFKNIEDQEV